MIKPPFNADAEIVAFTADGSRLKFNAVLSIQPRSDDEDDDMRNDVDVFGRWRFRAPRAWLDLRGQSLGPVVFIPRANFGKIKAGSVTLTEI